MTTKDEALKQSLDALEQIQSAMPFPSAINTIKMCRAALAQKDEQEPVAWVDVKDTHRGPYEFHGIDYMPEGKHPLYIAPPKRQPLTDVGINEIADSMPGGLAGFMKGWGWQQFARAIEAAHGIGAEHDAR